MDVLQEVFDRAAGRGLVASLIAGFCERKLAVKGVRLSGGERKRLLARLELGNYEDLTIRRWSWRRWERTTVTVEIEDTDLNTLSRCVDAWIEQLPTLVESVTKRSGDRVALALRRRWPKQKRHRRAVIAGFQRRLKVRWAQPLDLLETLIAVAQELGETTNEKLRESLQRAPGESDVHGLGPFRIEAITRLHARACQTAAEVLALLSEGLADGAMARWRTVHEIAVVALLLLDGDETLAERYLRHDSIEECRAAEEYQELYERLGSEPFDAEYLETLKRERALLKERWGNPYGTPYGWAASLLGSSNPKFFELEKMAGLDHLRPFYRLASHNVHANPKGVLYKLGLLDESNVLLAGSSDLGYLIRAPTPLSRWSSSRAVSGSCAQSSTL